jgi:hypothetical protein
VAYWLLTGKFVFEAPNANAMHLRHLQSAPPAPSASSRHAIPPALDELILECLAKEPAGRPANAIELGPRLGGCAAASAWSEETAQAWWAEHMTGALARDTEAPENGEPEPTTLTA